MNGRLHRELGSPVGGLITLTAIAASVAVVLGLPSADAVVRGEPVKALVFLGLALALQLCSVEVYGRGSIGVSAVGLLAAGFTLGPGAAMVIACVAALFQWVRKRGLLHRALFDAANLSLSVGTAALLYQTITALNDSTAARLGAAIAAGVGWQVVNTGLLCAAMSVSERLSIRAVWRERFHWARFHYLAFGPLAVASAIAYEKLGVVGLLAFALPPALLVISVRQYIERTRASVDEVRQANEELQRANAELAARNDDLSELFQFAGGLAARAHDRTELVAYAEDRLGMLTRTRVSLADEGAIELLAGERRVSSIELEDGAGFDADRWERLRDAILPQLATAIESADLVERVRKTHLDTIAALSRSMEAKDYYTGGHTERVSEVAVAIASRLGYSGPDLDAIEIGALLHDIGKIGIPERILHKQGPLDEEEWKVMKEHPVISEYILSGVDLSPIVLEVARSSHERLDGKGYPDGKRGEEIPLPARIVLVADAFDALTSDRPYRRGRHTLEAITELQAHVGTQFCPLVVEALERVYREEPHVLGPGTLRAVQVA